MYTYNMESKMVKQVSSVKYLGITMNEKNYNGQNMCSLGFLHRNLKSCQPYIKSSCYKSLVVPIIEYGSTACTGSTFA